MDLVKEAEKRGYKKGNYIRVGTNITIFVNKKDVSSY